MIHGTDTPASHGAEANQWEPVPGNQPTAVRTGRAASGGENHLGTTATLSRFFLFHHSAESRLRDAVLKLKLDGDDPSKVRRTGRSYPAAIL